MTPLDVQNYCNLLWQQIDARYQAQIAKMHSDRERYENAVNKSKDSKKLPKGGTEGQKPV